MRPGYEGIRFSEDVPKSIFSKYSIYLSAITVDSVTLIANPSSCCFIPAYSRKNVVCIEYVIIAITLFIGMLVQFPTEGSDSNRLRTTVRASSGGTGLPQVRLSSNCYR